MLNFVVGSGGVSGRSSSDEPVEAAVTIGSGSCEFGVASAVTAFAVV